MKNSSAASIACRACSKRGLQHAPKPDYNDDTCATVPAIGLVNSRMTSYNRYSHHARRALAHAATLVARYHHPGIDTGHLLVGVMRTAGSIGFQVLQDLNLHAGSAELLLKDLCPVLETPPEIVQNVPSMDDALSLAADEANWLGHHYIGTEHLLLGITRTHVGNATEVLRLMDVTPEQVRRRVRHVLSDGLTEFTLEFALRNVRFSELSRRVISAAEQMAVAMDHQTLGLGHLLLAMLMEKRSFTSGLLKRSGLNEDGLRRGLAAHDPLLLASIQPLLNQSLDYAERLGDHYTGTDHLLLTFTIDSSGIMVLQQYGLSPDDLRQRLEAQLQKKR